MSKLCILALLFYNTASISCFFSDSDVNPYRDRSDEARYNLLELFKAFDERNKESRRDVSNTDLENWTGRWMPDRPGYPLTTPGPANNLPPNDGTHKIPMGSTVRCDNGQINLTLDWDYSPVNYTCYGRKITPSFDINTILYTEIVPQAYVADHRCMNETITYSEPVPVYGTHRPAWPVYGEYQFLPIQRWLHSMEHGGVVMLYHPCANPLEVQRLKSLVTDCLRRHIITPYNLLDEEKPLVLVTWGARLSMSYVNPAIVKNFIRERALRGPEQIARDGTFSEGLLVRSKTVSDLNDSTLCPNIADRTL